jgi:hypothetical protein
MLFPREARAAQRCSCFPFFCGRNISSGISGALQNIALRNSFGRSVHLA